MRWAIRIAVAAAVAWLAYTVSPFVSLYRLTKAVERRDAAEIAERVNMRALRISLTRQLAAEYLKATGRNSASNRQLAEAGAIAADSVLGHLVTAETLIDLIEDGWPDRVAPNVAGAPPRAPSFASVKDVWSLFTQSQSHGFRHVFIRLPADNPEERYRLQMRLTGLTWKLSGIDLPASLRVELVKRIPQPGQESRAIPSR